MDRSIVDVSGLGPLVTRFHVYLAACRELHQRLLALEAVAARGSLDVSGSIAIFDEAMEGFLLRCTDADPGLAAMDFGKKLSGAFSSEQPGVVGLMADLSEGLRQTISASEPADELRAIHDPAREAARGYFAASPHAETQRRNERRCRIQVEYRDTFSSQAPMSHTAHQRGDQQPENAGTILLPFNATKNFSSYLDYPFLFLHEYTAHVIAIDHQSKNAIFNDGWMVVAADAYFIGEQCKNPDVYPFGPEQTQAFTDRLRGTIQGSCSQAVTYSQSMRRWLEDDVEPGRFELITYDLAAFRPQHGESETWPRTLVSRLLASYRADPRALKRHVRGTVTSRELMQVLPRLSY